MRSSCFCALYVAVSTPLAFAPAVAEPPTPVFWASDANHGGTAYVHEVLSKPLTGSGLKFQGAPLSEVVRFLREEYNVPVQLDLQSLDDLGLSPDDPIDIDVRDVSLKSALRIMLRQLDLTYVISNEVLLITSEEEALTCLTVAVYPVGDLLAKKQGHERSASAEPDKNEPVAAQQRLEQSESYNMDDLVNVIVSSTASDTWVENGGPEADIQPLQPGLLVISQTQGVHEGVANLLAAIRQAREHPFAMQHQFDSAVGTDPCRVLRQRAEEAESLAAYLRQAIERQEESSADEPPSADQRGGGVF